MSKEIYIVMGFCFFFRTILAALWRVGGIRQDPWLWEAKTPPHREQTSSSHSVAFHCEPPSSVSHLLPRHKPLVHGTPSSPVSVHCPGTQVDAPSNILLPFQWSPALGCSSTQIQISRLGLLHPSLDAPAQFLAREKELDHCFLAERMNE